MLFAVSYFLLAPWTVRNYRHFRAFLPFEQGAAYRNLYAATLGFVENTAGYGYQDVLAGELDTTPLASSDPVQRMRDMALASIRENPLPYLGSTVKRLVLAFRLHWLLWGLTVLLLFWRPRDPRPQLLAAVAFYFVAVHSPMSWEPRYFEPILPCLYALAGCSVAEALRRAARLPQTTPLSPPHWLTSALTALLLALHLLCAGYLGAEAAWLSLPCRMPESPLSLLRCAETKLARGDQALQPEPALRTPRALLARAPTLTSAPGFRSTKPSRGRTRRTCRRPAPSWIGPRRPHPRPSASRPSSFRRSGGFLKPHC